MPPQESTVFYPILEALRRQRSAVRYRFHVPAHSARLRSIWSDYDLTELPGLDQLHAPRGCIARARELAARLFNADATYFLVGGSSAGLAAAIFALCRPGDPLVLGRNSHRSVAAGLIFSGAVPHFLPVTEDPHGIPMNITAESAAAVLAELPAPPAGILLTSPNYWGVCADLPALAALAREQKVPLLVDEAHGGHFLFHPDFPPGAARVGAALWVNSAHKTLGALTPGAFLHLREGAFPQRLRLEEALSLLQTSSPPYPVLLSLDLVRGRLQERGKAEFAGALQAAREMRDAIKGLTGFRCLEPSDLLPGQQLDPLRLTITWDGLDLCGFHLALALQEDYSIAVELAGARYIVALVHPGLPREAVSALPRALAEIAARSRPAPCWEEHRSYPLPRRHLTPREAVQRPARTIPLAQAAGLVSAQLITPFPPGVPVLYPGEEITAELIDALAADLRAGVHFQDLDPFPDPCVAVVAE